MSNSIDIRVRHAIDADISHIDRLQNQAFPGDILLMSHQDMRDRCRDKIKGALLVATIDDLPVAYCVLTDRPFRPWTGWDFLAVNPRYSRLGIANKLTQQVFKSANRHFIRGFVRSKNTEARTLYRKLGFFKTGRRREFYSDGDDAILLLGHRFLTPKMAQFRCKLENSKYTTSLKA